MRAPSAGAAEEARDVPRTDRLVCVSDRAGPGRSLSGIGAICASAACHKGNRAAGRQEGAARFRGIRAPPCGPLRLDAQHARPARLPHGGKRLCGRPPCAPAAFDRRARDRGEPARRRQRRESRLRRERLRLPATHARRCAVSRDRAAQGGVRCGARSGARSDRRSSRPVAGSFRSHPRENACKATSRRRLPWRSRQATFPRSGCDC